MIDGINHVCIFDVKTNSDDSGDRTPEIESGKMLALRVDLVGLQTLAYGQSQGMSFQYSVEIPRYQYNGEKYLFMRGKLFEIGSVSKASNSKHMLLNVSRLEDEDLSDAIVEWITAEVKA